MTEKKKRPTNAELTAVALEIAQLLEEKADGYTCDIVLCMAAMLFTGKQATLTSHPF